VNDADSTGVGWRQLREFAGVDLERSYVLSWHAEGDSLVIDVDLYLEPEHPFFEPPRPAEKACIRAAAIEFPHCEDVRLTREGVMQDIELSDKIGMGGIVDLRVVQDHHYAISGEFGTVSLVAERPILRLKGA
jgi:hypothetical protein